MIRKAAYVRDREERACKADYADYHVAHERQALDEGHGANQGSVLIA